MRLAMNYDGGPESAMICCANTGEQLENVQTFRLERDEPRGLDRLTVTVFILRKGRGETLPEPSDTES